MVLNMVVAGLFGILVPVSLKRFNIDPAISFKCICYYYNGCYRFFIIFRFRSIFILWLNIIN